MKLRIAIWACVGALVVVFWTLYISAADSAPVGLAWTLACLTCPIALIHHYAVSLYVVLFVNAGTYALIGAFAEIVWRQTRRPHLISN